MNVNGYLATHEHAVNLAAPAPNRGTSQYTIYFTINQSQDGGTLQAVEFEILYIGHFDRLGL